MSRPFHAAAAGSNVSLAQLSVEQLRMRSTGHIFDASSIVADAERNGDMDKDAHLRLTDRMVKLIDVILETIRRQNDPALPIADTESAYETQSMGHGQLVVHFWLAASGASEDGLMLVGPLRCAVQAAHDRGERVTTARVDLETRRHALETLRADLSS